MNCIFCRISKKEIPAQFVFEDEKFVAFEDIHPKAPVHILVLPREHLASVLEAKGELLGAVVEIAKKIAAEKKLGGYKLVFNVGPAGGQVVEHLHLHLLGGWREKPGKVEV